MSNQKRYTFLWVAMLDDKGINNDYATSNTFFNGLTKTSQTQMQASA